MRSDVRLGGALVCSGEARVVHGLTLYVTDDCSLCDTALDILAAAGVPDFRSVFIDEDPALVARYGWLVPVLRDEGDDRELRWPFDVAAVRAFLTPHVASP